MVHEPRFLILVLLMAERAWAHCMQLKENVENYQAKFHARRRLAKASRHADQLLALCMERADEQGQLEAESYAAWFSGSVLMEREEWASARARFMHARTVYELLGKVGDSGFQALCQERLAEIAPSIRYCEFNMKQGLSPLFMLLSLTRPEGIPISRDDTDDALKSRVDVLNPSLAACLTFQSVVSSVRMAARDSLTHVTWRGTDLHIRSETTRAAFSSLQSLLHTIDSATSEGVSSADSEDRMTAEQISNLYDALFLQLTETSVAVDSDYANLPKVSTLCFVRISHHSVKSWTSKAGRGREDASFTHGVLEASTRCLSPAKVSNHLREAATPI